LSDSARASVPPADVQIRPLLRELEDKLEEWRSFYREAGYAGAEDDYFTHELLRHVIDAAARNTENNDARSALLYWARVWLFWLLGFATVAGIAYMLNQVRYDA
jgi:type VI protein secretion system component VasK